MDYHNWAWPQWTVLGMWVIGLLIHAANEGEPLKGKYSFGIKFIGIWVTAFVLWSGGFFQ